MSAAIVSIDAAPAKRKRPSWGEPGSHVTRRTTATVYSRGQRPVLVTIYPDGVIGLRLSKHRREEYVGASDLYRQAVTMRVAAERAAKRKAKR
jgi:hypothetical protein